MPEELSLDAITEDLELQPREATDQEVIDDYAELMREGTKFPPVDVFHDGEVYWLADGFHRLRAARQARMETLAARVHEGTKRDGILFSVGANAKHGRQRKNADKRKAVETLLRDEQWSQWSDAEIARRCRVSPNMVWRYRQKLSSLKERIETERKARRGDSTYWMTVKPRNEPSGAKIDEAAREMARDGLADAWEKPAEVKRLAKADEDQRDEIYRRVEDGNASSVAQAEKQIKRETAQPNPLEVDELTVAPGAVYHCNALDGLGKLADESIHLVSTDPPYNIGVDYGNAHDDSQDETDYFAWCGEWFAECARVLVDGGSFYAMHYPEFAARWWPMLEAVGLTFQRWITWVYPANVGQSESNWTRASRAILFATKGDGYTFNAHADAQPFRNPEDKRIRALIEQGQEGVTPYDWWEFDLVKNVSAEKTDWANQLPVALVERIIKTSSNEGDVVLDPFMGSGTTAEAAARNNRRWIGFDLNPESVVLASERTQGMV